MNRLIACGGTGAHVVLAMMRLHMLGYPLGFFRKNGKPLEFPNLYLVDQDAGDGIDDPTAWQAVRRLVDGHPGQYDAKRAFGRDNLPDPTSVSPLPVGKDEKWPAPPANTLDAKFYDSYTLPLIASKEQREIDYSLGMMGSPAVGSLLFKLKEYDQNPKDVNYDKNYSTMCRFEPGERVVVIGSGVGGTGASVTPTLAEKCAKDGAKVMAVMIQKWFKFSLDGNQEIFDKAFLRNERMEENEASGLASYGEKLAKNAAAVLVGVPESALCLRKYTSDNQQPIQDSYAHAVAALSAMLHFISQDPSENGVYGLSTSDKHKLAGDISIAGGTLRELVNKACVLRRLLEVLINALKDNKNVSSNKGVFVKIIPRIVHVVEDLKKSPKEVARQLEAFRKDYDENLNWLISLGVEGIKPDKGPIVKKFFFALGMADRLESHPLKGVGKSMDSKEVASKILHWAAEWIHDDWSEGLIPSAAIGGPSQGTVYWPDPDEYAEGLVPQAGKPGELVQVKSADVPMTLNKLYDHTKISQNGWPHPVATVEQFRFLIQNESPAAIRQLEILLVGLAAGKFVLEKVEERETSGPSVFRLLDDLRGNDFYGLASHRIVRKKDGKTLGLNSPVTLFCPGPDVSEEDWQEVWCDLTGSADGKEWETSKDWRTQERTRGSVKAWLEGLSNSISSDVPPWARALRSSITEASRDFSVGEWLPVYWGEQQNERKNVPIPSTERDDQASWDQADNVDRDEFQDAVPQFEKVGDFYLYKKFHIPGSDPEAYRSVIWKEHLDLLQKQGDIFAWRRKGRKLEKLEILWDLKRRVLLDVQVISRPWIRIATCIPLAQNPVPGSSSKTQTKYPDLPLNPEYIGLVKTEQGEDLAKLLVEGVSDINRLSIGKAKPGREEVTWELNLHGREKPVPITISVDHSQEDEERVRAHWMVWPGFRSLKAKGSELWRAYYMYARATRPSLGVRALYVDENDRLTTAKKQNPPGETFPGCALAFNFEERRHEGGPPVAFCAYDDAMQCDTGIYLIPLKAFPRDSEAKSWKLAVDFGTSHTVAATQDTGRARAVGLTSELTDKKIDTLSLHISENWRDLPEWHRALWRPTYIVDKVAPALIPSDIFSIDKLNGVNFESIKQWEPMRDYVIPSMELLRPDLPEHILSDFKWEITLRKFAGAEELLREIYLCRALEIFVADMVRDRELLPSKIDATFMYPLRNAMNQEAKNFGKSLRDKVLKRSSRDLGCNIQLVEGEGLYSESHAARGGTERLGEVIIVGDLGGGTLDMHISAAGDNHRSFREVADSVKLGGNLLLDLMAKKASKYLPREGGWSPNDPPAAAAKLRAYMRAHGSVDLFGDKGAGHKDEDLGLSGFGNAAAGSPARNLIDRYFWMIADYMARSVVAYIGKEWWPNMEEQYRDRLEVIVQLRGNGWRLWHRSRKYSEIQTEMKERVLSLANLYWKDVGMESAYGDWRVPNDPNDDAGADAKVGPVREVVGKTLGPDTALKKSYRLPLSDLELRYKERKIDKRWFDTLPFEDAKGAKPEIRAIKPSVVLEDPEGHSPLAIHTLQDGVLKDILNAIAPGGDQRSEDGGKLNMPVASLIWEKVFDSELTK